MRLTLRLNLILVISFYTAGFYDGIMPHFIYSHVDVDLGFLIVFASTNKPFVFHMPPAACLPFLSGLTQSPSSSLLGRLNHRGDLGTSRTSTAAPPHDMLGRRTSPRITPPCSSVSAPPPLSLTFTPFPGKAGINPQSPTCPFIFLPL